MLFAAKITFLYLCIKCKYKRVRRFFPVLLVALALLASGCSEVLKKPVLHGYTFSAPESIQYEEGVITTDMDLILDIENPARFTYSSDSLKIVLYKANGTIFGNATLRSQISIPKKSRLKVALPLKVKVAASPLMLAVNGFSGKGLDLESMYVDVDGIVKASGLKKKVHLEHQSLKEVGEMLKNMKYEDTRQ